MARNGLWVVARVAGAGMVDTTGKDILPRARVNIRDYARRW
jgi:hypothetical protein